MSKKCISCGAELAEDAAFCPYCETAQEEKRPAGMPRVRRKKGLRWAAAILAAAAVVTGGILWRSAGRTAQTEPDPETKQPGADTEANAVSVGQTTPWEGGAEVVYTDEAGQSYDLFLCFDTPRITERLPQEESVFAYSEGDPINKPSQLAVYDPETDEDLSERFFALVESCSVEAIPAEDGRKMELTEPEKNPNFQLAARMSFIQAKGGDGTNEICWTIRMKNGDEIILRQSFTCKALQQVSLFWYDAPMRTVEELQTYLDQLKTEYDEYTVIDLYLPASVYEGGVTIEDMRINLHGRQEENAQTTFTDTVTISSFYHFTTVENICFEGKGGIGLRAVTYTAADSCVFRGWDVGMLADEGGWAAPLNCSFSENGVGLRFDSKHTRGDEGNLWNNEFADNETAAEFIHIPGDMGISMKDCRFRNNGADVVNQTAAVIDTSEAIFE